ncbi:LEPR-XLL domain-containing protein, partial [Mariniblastus sp.]|nr:LEPR-XLL domain-containing protein [Mariniblastus sp.]
MGLIKKITDRLTGHKSVSSKLPSGKDVLLRRCYFEVMEQRRVLSADPVVAAVTYLEGDAGQDTTPDHFEVSFVGGAESTSLTQ